MKYSEESVWNAVGEIVPGFVFAKEQGVHMNLPTCLNSAAVRCFLMYDSFEFKSSFRKMIAADVIKQALLELNNNGLIVFGEEQ